MIFFKGTATLAQS